MRKGRRGKVVAQREEGAGVGAVEDEITSATGG